MAHIWGFRSDEEKRRKQYRDKKCTSSSRLLSRFWPKYTYTLYHARSVSLYLGNFLGFCDQRWKEGLARLLGHLESNSWLVYLYDNIYIRNGKQKKPDREMEMKSIYTYTQLDATGKRETGKRIRLHVFLQKFRDSAFSCNFRQCLVCCFRRKWKAAILFEFGFGYR